MRPIQAIRLLDAGTSTDGWTVTNGAMELDPNGPLGQSAIKATHTSGTMTLKRTFAEGVPALGKYIRFWLKVHGSEVRSVTPRITFAGGGFRDLTLSATATPATLVEGEQQVDYNYMISSWQSGDTSDTITAVQFIVEMKEGQSGGAISVARLETCYRKPYIMFVNDGSRAEFYDDVAPLLVARNLPFNLQLGSTAVRAYTQIDSNQRPDPYVSLDELRVLRKSGLVRFGPHINMQAESDEDFAEGMRLHLMQLLQLDLLDAASHVTMFQNNGYNAARWLQAKAHAATMRSGLGTGWEAYRSAQANYGAGPHKLTPVVPCPGAMLWDIPVAFEFEHTATPETAEAAVDNAIANQASLYVFGHGSNRVQNDWRSSLDTYRAFVERYEQRRHEIDWLLPEQVADRAQAANRNWNERLTRYSY